MEWRYHKYRSHTDPDTVLAEYPLYFIPHSWHWFSISILCSGAEDTERNVVQLDNCISKRGLWVRTVLLQQQCWVFLSLPNILKRQIFELDLIKWQHSIWLFFNKICTEKFQVCVPVLIEFLQFYRNLGGPPLPLAVGRIGRGRPYESIIQVEGSYLWGGLWFKIYAVK